MRVYIAGKLNDDAVGYLRNVHHMMEWAEEVRQLGHAVYVPALDLLMGVKFGYTRYAQYFENAQPWLEVSEVVFVCPGWEGSLGTAREIRRAEELGVPVVYSIRELQALVLEVADEEV